MRVGILGAMPSEVAGLISMPSLKSAGRTVGIDFYVGELAGRSAVVAQCGMGKVSAAICAQVMIDRFGATALVNIGTAGAMPGELPNGGFVISNDAVEADFDISPLGFAPGENIFTGRSSYAAAPRLIHDALAACRAAHPSVAATVGRVLTMDAFTSDPAAIARARDLFGGACMEMEGAAVGHTAVQNGVPFVLIRIIANRLDGNAADDYAKNDAPASAKLAAVVLELMQRAG